jgi:hypothetical protein
MVKRKARQMSEVQNDINLRRAPYHEGLNHSCQTVIPNPPQGHRPSLLDVLIT